MKKKTIDPNECKMFFEVGGYVKLYVMKSDEGEDIEVGISKCYGGDCIHLTKDTLQKFYDYVWEFLKVI